MSNSLLLLEVHQSELVVGDVVKIFEGMDIPADGYIIEANELTADESAMTGETNPRHLRRHPEGGERMRITAGRDPQRGDTDLDLDRDLEADDILRDLTNRMALTMRR